MATSDAIIAEVFDAARPVCEASAAAVMPAATGGDGDEGAATIAAAAAAVEPVVEDVLRALSFRISAGSSLRVR